MKKSIIQKLDKLLKLLYKRNFDPNSNKSILQKSITKSEINQELSYSDDEIDWFLQLMENRSINGREYLSIDKEKIKLEDLGVEHYYNGGFKNEYSARKIDNFWKVLNTRIVSLLSLLFSTIAICMSMCNFIQDNEENLFVFSQKVESKDSLSLNKNEILNSYSVFQPYSFTIVNNSKNVVSIVNVKGGYDYEFPENISKKTKLIRTSIISGKAYEENFVEFKEFPVKLSPGDKFNFNMKISMEIYNEQVVSLIDSLENKKFSSLKDLYQECVRDSIDIFGNKIRPVYTKSEIVDHLQLNWDKKNPINDEIIWILVRTSKGTEIKKEFGFYAGMDEQVSSYMGINYIFSK